jgi:hypothetical protein
LAAPYKEAVLATAGLVSFWALDESSGDALDAKGSNTGEVQGSPLRAQTSLLPTGEGSCIDLSGSGQYVKVPDAASLDLTTPLSLEVCFSPDSVEANQVLISHGNNGYMVRVEAGGEVGFWKKGSTTLARTNTDLTAGTSYYVCATKSGATSKIYLGELQAGGSVAEDTVAGSNAEIEATTIAVGLGGDAQFGLETLNGRIQYAAIYNTALSQATVEAHYAAGTSSGSTGPQFPLSRRSKIASF